MRPGTKVLPEQTDFNPPPKTADERRLSAELPVCEKQSHSGRGGRRKTLSADVPLTVTVAPKGNSAAAADVSPEAVYWTDSTTFDVDKCLNLTNRL